ncbi:hypothetical protein K469DRAFT_711033 [Zopfia rhizophila CBS 207.26]|uniref:Uncharacterized protein n=1 Tax=Zopfia rhizophila CBS 207.26 TaxID=1314779 RepID=A0A6A6DXJ0_9PEZI|nr:hypothetical protein K469DRAFT_711033 [Zopfia rhizophila CBS 207.26]
MTDLLLAISEAKSKLFAASPFPLNTQNCSRIRSVRILKRSCEQEIMGVYQGGICNSRNVIVQL